MAVVKVKVAQSSLFLPPHGLHSPWNFLGQNTGVDSLFLLQGIFPTQGSNPGLHSEVAQSYPTLCDPMDCSLPGFSVHRIFGFSRQEYWSGLPFPSPGDLPDLGIEPGSTAL